MVVESSVCGNNSTSLTMASSPTTLSIESRDFSLALERYIDENKPDPLMRKQMQAWELTWDVGELQDSARFSFDPSHMVAGTLLWKGQYMEVHLSSSCYWRGSAKEGSLFVSCQARATFREGKQDESKADKKVRRRMVKRLKDDDYIQKLLSESCDFCEASIQLDPEHLEERVHCNEVIVEAVRRAVFSTAESPLDVFDFVVSLPFLPCTVHKLAATTGLADRAKLRLLEDAMYDACEQEEEDEMVKGLDISAKRQKS